MTRPTSLLSLLLLPACRPASPPVSGPAEFAPILAAVEDTYSGDAAREVVAFVEQYWRLPGNRGFDASIARVAEGLREAGFVDEEDAGPRDRLTYRIERRPMTHPTWEPEGGSLTVRGSEAPLLSYDTNRNLLAINSHSTPPGGVEAVLVNVGHGGAAAFDRVNVRGRIVMGDVPAGQLYREAVIERGAIGVLSALQRGFNRPERHPDVIGFAAIPFDPEHEGWALRLSFAARRVLLAALTDGPVRVGVVVETRMYDAVEQTLVAEVRGSAEPERRFVFSAHVQEPGANDNASGVGALSEIAATLARLVRDGRYDPARTITMIWGDEIRSTARYLAEDSTRTAGVGWGVSLDMVGENTGRTGGTFLIEKMPDPSAVWTRGRDHHTEWGGEPLDPDALTPHYFNDFVLHRCLDRAAATGWVVRTNPFEGGSDHVPFIRAGKPGLLLWHFTDEFYHTDGDRLEMVSPETLANVGTCAAVSAMVLASADGGMARRIVAETLAAAMERLDTESALSREALARGGERTREAEILRAWTDWYREALEATADIEVGGTSSATRTTIERAVARVRAHGEELVAALPTP